MPQDRIAFRNMVMVGPKFIKEYMYFMVAGSLSGAVVPVPLEYAPPKPSITSSGRTTERMASVLVSTSTKAPLFCPTTLIAIVSVPAPRHGPRAVAQIIRVCGRRLFGRRAPAPSIIGVAVDREANTSGYIARNHLRWIKPMLVYRMIGGRGGHDPSFDQRT